MPYFGKSAKYFFYAIIRTSNCKNAGFKKKKKLCKSFETSHLINSEKDNFSILAPKRK